MLRIHVRIGRRFDGPHRNHVRRLMLAVLAADVGRVVHEHLRAIQADVVGHTLHQVIKIPLFLGLFPLLREAEVHARGVVVFPEDVIRHIQNANGFFKLRRSEHAHGVVVLRANRILSALTTRDADHMAAHTLAQGERSQPVRALIVGMGRAVHGRGDGSQRPDALDQLDHARIFNRLIEHRRAGRRKHGHKHHNRSHDGHEPLQFPHLVYPFLTGCLFRFQSAFPAGSCLAPSFFPPASKFDVVSSYLQ